MDSPIFPKDCTSLLSKHLSPALHRALAGKKTGFAFTFEQLISSGVKNLDSGIGVYAGDEESYDLFAPLLDPIIEQYHGFGGDARHQSNLNPDDLDAPNPDPDGEYVISTRIRVGRNLQHFPLGPAIHRQSRQIAERMIAGALARLEGDLKGRYYPLLGMPKEIQAQLIADHFLFKQGDRFLEASGLNRDWPEGRGIYHNDDKTFLVWVNEEDQLRIISMQRGGDIKGVFSRLCRAIVQIQKRVRFAYSERLGYITSCPTNLGTAMRASVHIKLPKLARDMTAYKAITDRHHLQIRGVHGEHSESEGGTYDISNRRRLGISEVRAVQDMVDGVTCLIAAEKALC